MDFTSLGLSETYMKNEKTKHAVGSALAGGLTESFPWEIH